MIDSTSVIQTQAQREHAYGLQERAFQRQLKEEHVGHPIELWNGGDVNPLDYHQARELAILRLVQAAAESADENYRRMAGDVLRFSTPWEVEEWALIENLVKANELARKTMEGIQYVLDE